MLSNTTLTVLLDTLDAELSLAEQLLQELQALRGRLSDTGLSVDFLALAPHETNLQRLQQLNLQRQELLQGLELAALPESLTERRERLAALGQRLKEENAAIGELLQARLLFVNRVLSNLGQATTDSSYTNSGSQSTAAAPQSRNIKII
jgi:flagellar biosynthesis/type III secretory pathway chaperone